MDRKLYRYYKFIQSHCRCQRNSDYLVVWSAKTLSSGLSLCANMNETLTPREFRVEGEKGLGDEFLGWSGTLRSGCQRGRGDGQGNPAAVLGRVQAEDSARSGGVHAAGGDRRAAPLAPAGVSAPLAMAIGLPGPAAGPGGPANPHRPDGGGEPNLGPKTDCGGTAPEAGDPGVTPDRAALHAGTEVPTAEDASRGGRPFLVGFSIGISNPITLLWFLTVGGALIAAHGGGGGPGFWPWPSGWASCSASCAGIRSSPGCQGAAGAGWERRHSGRSM